MLISSKYHICLDIKIKDENKVTKPYYIIC
jgi:hypothetical protein